MVAEFGLEMGREIVIRNGELFRERETRAASAVAYFGGSTHPHQVLAHQALDASLPIIPTVPPNGNFAARYKAAAGSAQKSLNADESNERRSCIEDAPKSFRSVLYISSCDGRVS